MGARIRAAVLVLALLVLGAIGSPASATALAAGPSWQLVAQDDFHGGLAPHWTAYQGRPACCAETDWDSGQVSEHDGRMTLTSVRRAGGWVTGGVSAAGWPAAVRTYGKYIARVRVDRGSGISAVALLWPQSGQWPPELDYYELSGVDGDRTSETATDHRAGDNAQLRSTFHGDLTQWHTVGLIWLPNEIRYFVDGHQTGQVTDPSYIPHQPMWPAFQMQVGATGQYDAGQVSGAETGPVTMQISGFAVYAPVSGVVTPGSTGSGWWWLWTVGAGVLLIVVTAVLIARRRG